MGCHPDPAKLVQITNWAGNSTNPYIAAFGSAVVFQSDVFGSSQIFLYDLANGGLITQITNGAGDSSNPTIDETGNFITFQSNADLLGTGLGGREVRFFQPTQTRQEPAPLDFAKRPDHAEGADEHRLVVSLTPEPA